MTTHQLMLITSVQGYCTCGQWGMASADGLDRLRELHATHTSTPCATCYAASTPPGTPPPPVIRYCTWHAKEVGK